LTTTRAARFATSSRGGAPRARRSAIVLSAPGARRNEAGSRLRRSPGEPVALRERGPVLEVRRVVSVELALAPSRDEGQDPDVAVAHDDPSVGRGSATATATSCGRASGLPADRR
jgi:hypothetical protein